MVIVIIFTYAVGSLTAATTKIVLFPFECSSPWVYV